MNVTIQSTLDAHQEEILMKLYLNIIRDAVTIHEL